MSKIIRLISCVWHLGFRNGWRFWQVQNAVAKYPDLIPKMERAFLFSAAEMRKRGRCVEAAALEGYARDWLKR